MVNTCRATFSLMRKHVCAFGKQSHPAAGAYLDGPMANGAANGNKRKAGGLGRDDHLGKRLRTMDPDAADAEGAHPALSLRFICSMNCGLLRC